MQSMIGCLVLGVFAVISLATCRGGDDKKVAINSPISAFSADTLKEDADFFLTSIENITVGCDDAFQEMGDAMQNGDVIEAYTRAKRADAECLSVKLNKISIPTSFDHAQREAATKALESCDSAYTNRWWIARQAQKILDGGNRVSAQAEFRETSERAPLLFALCKLSLVHIDTFGEPELEPHLQSQSEPGPEPDLQSQSEPRPEPDLQSQSEAVGGSEPEGVAPQPDIEPNQLIGWEDSIDRPMGD